MDIGLPKSLSTLVSNKFTTAERAGHLTFSPTKVTLISGLKGVSLQSRFCPSLAKKPTSKEKDEKKKFNPFENPSPELLVTTVPTSNPTHRIVLNKFPIIKNHFILSTIPWKSQTDLLDVDDLALTHALLRTWPAPGTQRSLFAFFNSGPHSGASQPHRHLQFLPVEDMMTEETPSWRPAIETMSDECRESEEYMIRACSAFPFAHFACRLPLEADAGKLHEAYLSLLSAAAESIPPPSSDDLSVTEKGPDPPDAMISYNLAMTTTCMVICPRRSESATLSNDGGEVGFNGTVLAGTFMLKDESVWNRVQEKPEEMERVLRGIGYPFPETESGLEDDIAAQRL